MVEQSSPKTSRIAMAFESESARWAAVVARDQKANGAFVYSVKTTRIFCRPVCKARLARRSNIGFFDTPPQAEAAGYRACKRCHPKLATFTPDADRIRKVCKMLRNIPENAPLPPLDLMAQEAGLTKHHFHRMFKKETGLTPRHFALASRQARPITKPESEHTPSDSTSDGSLPSMAQSSGSESPVKEMSNSPLTFDQNEYEQLFLELQQKETAELLDSVMLNETSLDFAPTNDETLQSIFDIYFTIISTTHGLLLVAFQSGRMCQLELGLTESELMARFQDAFPSGWYTHIYFAQYTGTDELVDQINAVIEALENPSGKTVDCVPPLLLSYQAQG